MPLAHHVVFQPRSARISEIMPVLARIKRRLAFGIPSPLPVDAGHAVAGVVAARDRQERVGEQSAVECSCV